MSLHHCSAVSRSVHLSLWSAAVRTCRDEKSGRAGRSGKGKGDVEKRGAGEQGEGKRDKSEGVEEGDGGTEMEMKRGTIKDSRVCGGSVKAGGL